MMWLPFALALLPACGRVGFDAVGGSATSDATGGSGSIQMIQASALTSVTSASAATVFAAPPGAGNTIVVYAWAYSNTIDLPTNAVTDDGGNSYKRAVAVQGAVAECSSGQAAVAIYFAPSIQSAATPRTVTVTSVLGTGMTEVAVVAVEYAGLDPVDPLDAIATRTTPPAASPFTMSTGTTPTTVADVEVVAAVATACSGYPNPVGWTNTMPFTVRGEESRTQFNQPGQAADRIVDAIGQFGDAWSVTFTGTEVNASYAAIATFR